MMKTDFGATSDGRTASLYFLRNSAGTEAAVTDYGAALVRLLVRDREGSFRDVVLGYDDVSGYETEGGSFGGTVGRFANRIGQGRFNINGTFYELTKNNGPNTLHGGRDPYIRRFWNVKVPDPFRRQALALVDNSPESSITFTLNSPDGDQGFPGNVTISVTYTLSEEDELHIDYRAISDADTPLNLTNHSYFNLGGHDSGSVLSQIATIHARQFTEPDKNSLPTGRFLPVEGTPMDFLHPKMLGKDIDADYEPLLIAGGYDHNFVIEGEGYRKAARLYCPETGIRMTVKTDLPGVQFYTANFHGTKKGKSGVIYHPRDGVCFETQYYPDSINKEHFPGGVLQAGEVFTSRTSYCFTL